MSMKRTCGIAVVVLGLIPAASLAQPQNPDPDGCVDNMIPGTPVVEGFVSKNGTACPAGTWVQKGQSVTVDFTTQSAGSCQVNKPLGSPPTCQLWQTQYRGIGLTRITTSNDGGYAAVYPNPNTGPVFLDTRPAGTSTPDSPSRSFGNEGEQTVTWHSNLNATACNFTPLTVSSTPITFRVISCAPDWLRTAQGPLVHNIANPSQPIIVRVPTTMNPNMKAGIAAAVTAWNDALNSYGPSVGPR